MPYLTIEHVRKALDYVPAHTHPALMSLLAMLRAGVPSTDDRTAAIRFGSTDERRLLEDYFRPEGGPDDRPYFLVFGPGYGYSHWKDSNYPGRTLQVQRGKHDLFVKSAIDNKRWMLAPGLASHIAENPEPIGTIPIAAVYLAIWCYRTREIQSVEAVVETFVGEFRLRDYGLVPRIFSTELPMDVATIPLADTAIDSGDLLQLLQSLEPTKAAADPDDTDTRAGSATKFHEPADAPGDWGEPSGGPLQADRCGLQGLDEAVLRAQAALAAGMHVIFTGPPGSGKTKLAECICRQCGFPSWTVPATDQWTTFETIGGYFPMPVDGGSGDRLDFLPGAVVDSLEKGLCLIIDEINRADIDKAFGELFTLLSGNTVVLPYRRRGNGGTFRRIRLQVGPGVVDEEETDVIVVPGWWRIIGSMNDADKASLKRLSMAFVRRFAFVPVGLPETGIYEGMVRGAVAKTSAARERASDMDHLADRLVELFCYPDRGLGAIGLPLGPAFPLSIVKHADNEWRIDASRPLESVLASAVELYVMPQLQGRPDLHEKASGLFGRLLGTTDGALETRLAVWTGFVS